MILFMNRHIRDKGIKNVVTILSAADDPLLRTPRSTVFSYATRGTTSRARFNMRH